MSGEYFINTGDRIVVTEGVLEDTHKRRARPELVGKYGLVIDNDGWGFCKVQLDDGTIVNLWNEKDLKWA